MCFVVDSISFVYLVHDKVKKEELKCHSIILI